MLDEHPSCGLTGNVSMLYHHISSSKAREAYLPFVHICLLYNQQDYAQSQRSSKYTFKLVIKF